MTGLLLPWLGGTLWLVVAESFFQGNQLPSRLRQAGYGFFLGYIVLFFAIMMYDSLSGSVSWPGLILAMFVFATSGAVALWVGNKSKSPASQPNRASFGKSEESVDLGKKLLFVGLLAWITVHVAFMAVEVFTRPVFPWDAWTTWIYRAKAWFFSGGIADMVSPAQWAATKSADAYTGHAWDYPYFPSVIPFWSALSLGRWSETLVNVPVLLAGTAMGMAFYGQCRESGLSALACLTGCYLLFSIPLFGTHIALAGYADIWMAGFVGLGFIAIMRGSIEKLRFQTILGFVMVSLGVLVKFEAFVWLLAAVLLQILVSGRLRFHVLAATIITAAITITIFLGIHSIDIPLVGTLSLQNGRLEIPFIGNFKIEAQMVWGAYWENFFTLGSWNLLWLLVVAGIILALKSPWDATPYSERRVSLSFIIVFLATQLFIFGFTEMGAWATRFTAINRLPLQFIPALLYAAIVVFNSRLTQKNSAISHA
jgi:hypothetical protein